MEKNDWEKFTATGAIEYYLHFKQGIEGTPAAKEAGDADHHTGACSASNKNG